MRIADFSLACNEEKFFMLRKIIAAGGLVINNNKELLMIFRRGKWDLPKGKLDEGESIEDCALREVKEETGLQKVNIENPVGITYHKYFDERLREAVIKETYWFKMFAENNQPLTPQYEEDIEIIEWVDKKNLQEKLNNSYPNIHQIIGELKRKFID